MRIGILADVHENLGHLRWAIDILRDRGADCLVFLGDVVEMGHRLRETVDLLVEASAVGVWGNHDFGLCGENQTPDDRLRYGEPVLGFMRRLQPRLEVEGCLFTHIEPWLDPEKIEDLWYFDGPPESREQVSRIFTAVANRVMFVGDYHRWLLVTPDGLQPWSGDEPTVLKAEDQIEVRL